MALRDPRDGKRLFVLQRPLPFSLWPVGRGIRRYRLSDYLFSRSPWNVIRGAIGTRTEEQERLRTEAIAFVDQAESFFEAAQSRQPEFTPLLFYYSFLNLAKAYILTSGVAPTVDRAMHGLKDDPGLGDLESAQVAVKYTSGTPNIFPLLARALRAPVPPRNKGYPVTELMAQVVVGHRLWREAGAGKDERFVALRDVRFFRDVPQGAGSTWLRFYVEEGDLERFRIAQGRFLSDGQIDGLFHRVKSDVENCLCFEQIHPIPYAHRAADVVKQVVDVARPVLWRVATAMPPYRRYYVCLSPPPAEFRLPQLLSLYMLFFYFGSVSRYRPHVFEEILRGPYGPFVGEFIESQPDQLLYLLASELCEREVAKPAIA